MVSTVYRDKQHEERTAGHVDFQRLHCGKEGALRISVNRLCNKG
jgi:hypothetical protein